MASVSGLSSLHPQVKIVGDQLVIEKGIVNSQGRAYDITINFKSSGHNVPPPAGQLQRESLVEDINAHAKRILDSLRANHFDTDHLERIGFRVQNDVEGNPKTEILTSAVKPIFESLRSGDMDGITIHNGADLSMQPDANASDDAVSSKTVHEELLSLRSLFRAEYVMVVPASQNPEIVSASDDPSLPDVSLSFRPVETPEPSHKKPPREKIPAYPLFELEGSIEKRREILSRLRAGWKEFLSEYPEYNKITVEQLLGFAAIEEDDKDLLRELFNDSEIKSSLYKKFQDKASDLCKSYFGVPETTLLKRNFLDVLESRWISS